MVKLNEREKTIFIVCVVLIAAFGVFQLVLKPLKDAKENAADRIRVDERKLKKNLEIIKHSQSTEKQYQKLIEVMGTAGTEGAEVSTMVSRLEAAAKEADIHIANMQPQHSVVKQDIVRVFPVELVIDGQWAAITKFLYLVQSPPDLLNIEELNLEKYSDATAALRGRIVLSRVRVIGAK